MYGYRRVYQVDMLCQERLHNARGPVHDLGEISSTTYPCSEDVV